MDQGAGNPASTPSKPFTPGTKIGGYTILYRIAEGTTTRVYAAEGPTAGRTVALKLLHRPIRNRGDAYRRFVDELRASAKVEHPHLLAVYDLGDHDDHPYLALEHVEGESVDRSVLKAGALDPRDAADIIEKCCRGLHALHEKGRLHGSLEPRHVLLGKDGTVKLGESVRFSRMVREHDGTEVAFLARPTLYASPEEVSGSAPADIRSDIHALGGILFTLLSGKPPFGDTPLDSVMWKISRGVRASVRQDAPVVDDELAGITLRAMALVPRERFETPLEMADAIRAYVKRVASSTDAPPQGSRLDIKVEYTQREERRLIGTLEGHSFCVGILPVVGHVTFPLEETWNKTAPPWARNCWYAARRDCRESQASMGCDATGWVTFLD